MYKIKRRNLPALLPSSTSSSARAMIGDAPIANRLLACIKA